MPYSKCPNCGANRHKNTAVVGVFECVQCGAVYGSCYLGESYEFVMPYMTTESVPSERTRYYDFECLGSGGITRRHGWFDPATKRIVQVG